MAAHPGEIFIAFGHREIVNLSSLSSSSYICHAVRPLVDPFRSHVPGSLFRGLPRFFLPVKQYSFITLGNFFEAFYLHVVSSFSCIPVFCPKLVLFFNSFAICAFFSAICPKCILLLFSCISSLLLLFFWRPLL